jgi:RNA-binding protein YlmH
MDDHRLTELADRSYRTGIFTFTDFLSMAELAAYYEQEGELQYASPSLFGGCEQAERQMIRFGGPEEIGYDQPFPISALAIRPLQAKFADDLTHRDFLGALMNLGILKL